jgi:hypothetical protein
MPVIRLQKCHLAWTVATHAFARDITAEDWNGWPKHEDLNHVFRQIIRYLTYTGEQDEQELGLAKSACMRKPDSCNFDSE